MKFVGFPFAFFFFLNKLLFLFMPNRENHDEWSDSIKKKLQKNSCLFSALFLTTFSYYASTLRFYVKVIFVKVNDNTVLVDRWTVNSHLKISVSKKYLVQFNFQKYFYHLVNIILINDYCLFKSFQVLENRALQLYCTSSSLFIVYKHSNYHLHVMHKRFH